MKVFIIQGQPDVKVVIPIIGLCAFLQGHANQTIIRKSYLDVV